MSKSLASRVISRVAAFAGITLMAVTGLSLNLAVSHADNLTLSTASNCDANAVMYCGASSTDSLITKYSNGDGTNSAASIQHIYRYFGITSSDVQAMSSSSTSQTVEIGSVTKDGKVYDSSNKLVASSAVTAGREDIAGSTTKTYDGTTFYVRSPSVSFASNTLAAYVVMQNNKFDFAILGSCGNPVTASPIVTTPTPKPTPTPQPTPTPAAPAPTTVVTPPPTVTMTNIIYNTVTTTQPSPQPVATTPAPAATTTSLVSTGPADEAGLFIGVFVVSAAAYQIFLRRKIRNSIN